MGLGKTIQTLSLIAADLKASRICRELHQRSHQCSHCRQSSGPTFSSSSFSSSGSCSSSSAFSAYSSPCSVASRSANYSLAFPSLSGNRFGSASHPWARHLGGTLVIVPLSLVKQWREEVYVHMAPEAAVSVVAYSGQSRTRDGAELSKFDVVLTTYQTVAAEFPQLFFEQMNKQTNEAASTASAAQAEVKQDTHAKPKNRSKKSNSASFFKDGKGNYFSSSSSSSPSSSSSSSFSSSLACFVCGCSRSCWAHSAAFAASLRLYDTLRADARRRPAPPKGRKGPSGHAATEQILRRPVGFAASLDVVENILTLLGPSRIIVMFSGGKVSVVVLYLYAAALAAYYRKWMQMATYTPGELERAQGRSASREENQGLTRQQILKHLSSSYSFFSASSSSFSTSPFPYKLRPLCVFFHSGLVEFPGVFRFVLSTARSLDVNLRSAGTIIEFAAVNSTEGCAVASWKALAIIFWPSF
eukprot:GHVT01061527.1.p1 GENE.GHVT01061527.1~~GHVT01061527.1.p1  ORF type:complete len:495 (+),score=140.46 GHVT01061527.1:71-1486(+)